MKLLRRVAIILFFVLVAVLLVHSLNSINQDIGRHLKSGEIIWETGQVYKTNLFSFTEPDYPFVNHHWLAEVMFYLLEGWVGLKGLIVFKAGLILAAFGLVWASVYKKTGLWPLILAAFTGILVFTERTDVRPEIFSYLFLAFFLFAILQTKYRENCRWLYWLPFIQLIWTNTHIYFALGPGMLLFFLVDQLIHNPNRELKKKFFLLFLATSLATLLNPNFIKGALAPLTILKHYGYSIVENQSIFFLIDYDISLTNIQFFEISLVILILGFVIAFKNGRQKVTFEFLAALFFAIMGAKMIRNLGIYALVFLPITALNLAVLPQPGFAKQKAVKASFYILVCLGLGFLIFNVVNNKFYDWLPSPKRFGLIIPNGAAKGVEFVKQNKIAGPVFNNFDVGSFLIWKLYPEQKVFVDGRPEAYSVEFFEKIYKPIQEEPSLWQKYSQEYGINYVFFDHRDITPWARSFLSQISKNSDWAPTYIDESVVILLKRNDENQKVISKFEIKSQLSNFFK